MSNNNINYFTFSQLSKKFDTILINGKDEFMKAIKNKNIKLIGLVEKSNSNSHPKKSKLDLILEKLENIDQFIVEQRKFNAEQKKFNKYIVERLDRIVSVNNLKE